MAIVKPLVLCTVVIAIVANHLINGDQQDKVKFLKRKPRDLPSGVGMWKDGHDGKRSKSTSWYVNPMRAAPPGYGQSPKPQEAKRSKPYFSRPVGSGKVDKSHELKAAAGHQHQSYGHDEGNLTNPSLALGIPMYNNINSGGYGGYGHGGSGNGFGAVYNLVNISNVSPLLLPYLQGSNNNHHHGHYGHGHSHGHGHGYGHSDGGYHKK
ncbi:hypothetical protein HDE_09867 [Halotydeus destructor]|nr:hypothetical protein HDE_09867 [Halotydeus destructor]